MGQMPLKAARKTRDFFRAGHDLGGLNEEREDNSQALENNSRDLGEPSHQEVALGYEVDDGSDNIEENYHEHQRSIHDHSLCTH